jgi:hypothetical protein
MPTRLANCAKWSLVEHLSGKVAQFEGMRDD